jgi:hypothetical protein
MDREERMHVVRRRALALCGTLVAGIALAMLTGRMTVAELTTSGFLAFLSLVIADPRIVLAESRALFLALIESLPTMSIAMFFLATFIALRCLIALARSVRMVAISMR